MAAVSFRNAAVLRPFARGQFVLTGITALALSVSSVAVASAAGTSAPAIQAKFSVTASSTSVQLPATVTVHAKGGSGTGAVRYAVTGAMCSIGAVSGVVRATSATTCVVKATKAATTRFKKATSSAISVHFTAAVLTGTEFPTYGNPDKASLVTSSWSTTGFLGTGPVDDSVNGDNWFITSYYSPSDKWLYTYVHPGATVTLTWKVTGSYGQPLANTPVTLATLFAPGANNGKGDTTATFNAAGISNGNLSGTTDASGMVTFTITNTNGSAPTAPATWNSTKVSVAPGVAAGTTVAAVAAETIESGSGYSWTRMLLKIGSDTVTGDPASALVNQSTDLVDVIVVS